MNPSPDSKSEFSFYNVLKLFRAHKKFLVVFIGAFLCTVLIYTYIMPHEYKATATLLPPSDNDGAGGLSNFLQSFAGGGVVLGAMGQSNQSKIFGEILQSRSVADFIEKKYKLMENEDFNVGSRNGLLDNLRSMIEVEIERSGLVLVTFSTQTGYFPGSSSKDTAARRCAEFTNSAVEALDNVIRKNNMSSAHRTRKYIEEALIEYNKILDSLESRLEDFQSRNKVITVEEQTDAVLGQAIEVGSDLTEAEIKLNLARQLYNPNHPELIAYEKSVDFLREQYNKIQQGGLIATDAFSIPLDKVPAVMREYRSLVRDQKILEKVILYLETQKHQEAIQEERDIPIVEVLDEAVKPDKRYSPSRSLMMTMALFISSILACGIVILRAFIKGTLYMRKERAA